MKVNTKKKNSYLFIINISLSFTEAYIISLRLFCCPLQKLYNIYITHLHTYIYIIIYSKPGLLNPF